MPRYFFHFNGGKRTFTDDTGTELAGLGDARKHAIRQARELKGAISEQTIQSCAGWKVITADANGKIVLEIGFDLTPRPLH
jgi:hypothetical protein